MQENRKTASTGNEQERKGIILIGMTATSKFWTLSFSGAGLLLPYHLGAARILSSSPLTSPIKAVAGSSSGAIAATLVSLFPHRLEEYVDRFLHDGGRGLTLMKEIMESESLAMGSKTFLESNHILLFVCVTKSIDGSMHLLEFDPKDGSRQESHLFRAIHASCMIPRSFHPYDIFSKQRPSYPDGIEIDGELYCDGGIASPAPPTTMDNDPNCARRILISPISQPKSDEQRNCIRPTDHSLALPFALTSHCGSFRIRPSLQNLRAAIVSTGATTPDVLRDWYQRGADDASAFLDSIQ